MNCRPFTVISFGPETPSHESEPDWPISSSVSGAMVPLEKPMTRTNVRNTSGATAGQNVLRAAHNLASSGKGLPSAYPARCSPPPAPDFLSVPTSQPGAKTPAASSGRLVVRRASGWTGQIGAIPDGAPIPTTAVIVESAAENGLFGSCRLPGNRVSLNGVGSTLQRLFLKPGGT